MTASAVLLICTLMCVGALLHLAWRLALAALVWAPSGYAGMVCGWHAAEILESTTFGIVGALGAAALVRFAILALAARVFPPRFVIWGAS